MLHAFIFNYLFPLFLISIFYAQVRKSDNSFEIEMNMYILNLYNFILKHLFVSLYP